MPQSVSLVWVTPDAEHLITDMARVSAPSNQGSYDTAPRLLKYLIKHRHWSPFEMASMCVEINTTRDIAAQIIRHRSFSFQEFSQRYANVRDIGELEIPELRLQDKTNRQNSITGGLSSNIVEYLEHKTAELFADAQLLYDEMISLGVAKECARKVLPMNSPSRIYMTGTLRSWMHYIDLRSSNGTQKEHMEIALAIKDIFAEEFPCIAAALKPTPPPQPVKEEPQDITPEPVSLWEKVKKAVVESLPYFS